MTQASGGRPGILYGEHSWGCGVDHKKQGRSGWDSAGRKGGKVSSQDDEEGRKARSDHPGSG